MFALSWTALHRIDESSPFWPKDGPNGAGGLLAALEDSRAQRGELFLSFTGIDETLGQTIHARHSYSLGDIIYNARFADVLTIEPDGTRIIDYGRFHEVERLGDPDDMALAAE